MGQTPLTASNSGCNLIMAISLWMERGGRRGMEEATASSDLSFSPFPVLLKKHLLKTALSQTSQEGE